MSESVRHKGVVKWFSDEKGFGFISIPGHTKDIFVHKSAVTKSGFNTLKEGDRVSIILADGQKGTFASNIMKE